MKLKDSLFVLFAGASLVGLGSCAESDVIRPDDSSQVAVLFTPQIEGSFTRASDTNWTSGDKVGIAMITAGTALTTGDVFKEYTVAAGGASATLTPPSSDPHVFPSSGDVNFVAFSPNKTVTSSSVAYTLTDQDTSAKVEAVDFLYHKGTTPYNKTSGAVALGFGHKFSKFVINVTTTPGSGEEAVDLSNLAVTITGTPGSATVNLANGQVTAGGVAPITPHCANTNNSSTVTAIVVPHAAVAGRTITFAVAGQTKTFTISKDQAIDPNKKYALSFNIVEVEEGEVVVQLTSGTIGNWDDAGTIAEEVSYVDPSNSYIVAPGATIHIPVSRANEYTAAISAADAIGTADAFTTELVWADDADLLATVEPYAPGATGAIKVTAAEGKSGNAVVAVKVGGEIKWSWHIWVTDYDPEVENTTHTGNGYTFMSRNLGAKAADLSADAYGLYYQWGRKDPFPATGNPGEDQAGGGTFTATARSAGTGTVPYTILHPDEFITFNGDWLVTKQDGLWGQGTDKSLYDPCPSGWRVPGFTDSKSPWVSFTKDNGPWDDTTGATGRNWSAATYNDGVSDVNLFVPQQFAKYPAAGLRNNTSGAIGSSSSSGNYWSGAVSGANGYYMGFTSGSMGPSYNGARAFGFPVRCVKEQ